MSDDPMLQEHKATYHSFVRLVIFSTAAVVAALIFMAVVLL
jgi:hypothetical protein